MARVVLDHVSKCFQSPSGQQIPALQNVSLEIGEGEFMVLVGPSGSGKTTLLRLIAGLEELSRGAISIAGVPVHQLPAKDRDVAIVFQNYALYPHMTVAENLAFALKLRHVAKAEIQRRVGGMADMLGLNELLRRTPGELSGGQRQRVALGRALVRQPMVLLLDEPLSNLDAPMRVQLRIELANLHRRLGITMLYVTHDQTEAMTLGQRVAVLDRGEIQQVAAPLTLYQKPANRFVAGFIGSPAMNFWRGAFVQREEDICFELERAQSRLFVVTGGQRERFEPLLSRPVIFGIRPERIKMPENPVELAGLQGTIELVEPLGAETIFHLRALGEAVLARIPGPRAGGPGEAVRIEFALEDGYLFDAQSGQAIEWRERR